MSIGRYYPMHSAGMNIIKTTDGQQIVWGPMLEGTTINRNHAEGVEKFKELAGELKTSPTQSLINKMKKLRVSMY